MPVYVLLNSVVFIFRTNHIQFLFICSILIIYLKSMFLSAPETTEVIYGVDNIIDKTLKGLPELKKSLDGCYDSAGPSMVVTT
jgi:hypothetical protein